MSESLGDAVLTLRTNNLPFNTGMASAEARMAAFSQKARAAGLALTAGLTLPILGLAVVATKAFTGFNKAMTGSLAIMGDVTEAMQDRMVVAARRMGRETLFSAEQAAESYFFLASAGLDAATSIEALPIVAEFAQAGLFDMALATDLLTDAQSALGLKTGETVQDMENMVRISDVLSKANQVSNATVQQFAEALTNELGAALKTSNKDVEEGVAVLAAFADQGVKGQVAGAQLARIMRLMGSAAVNNAGAMNELGITVFDAEGNWLNFADIVESMEVAFDGMSDAQRTAALESIGFTARVQGAILPLLGTSEAIRQYEEDLRNAGGTTQEISDNQLESASAKWTIFKGRLEDVAIVLGAALVPALLSLMDSLVPLISGIAFIVDAFTGLSPVLQNTIFIVLGLLAALGPVVFIVGALAGAASSLVPIWGLLMASFAGPALLGLVGSLGGLLIPLALVAGAVALIIFKWEELEPVIGPVVAAFVEGLDLLAERLANTAKVLQKFDQAVVRPFFAFVMGNGPVLIAMLIAIGAAFVWAFPPFGIAAGIVIIIGAVEILKTRNEDLNKSALRLKLIMLQLGESFLVAAQAAKDAALSGLGPLAGVVDFLADKFDGLDKKTDEMTDRVMAATEALVLLNAAERQTAADTAFLFDNMAALIPVMQGNDQAMHEFIAGLAQTEVANFQAAHAVNLTQQEIAEMTQGIFASRKEMLQSAKDSGAWSSAVASAAAAAGLSIDAYTAKLAVMAQMAVVASAMQALLNSTLQNVGTNAAEVLRQVQALPGLLASLQSAIGGATVAPPSGGGSFAGFGGSGGGGGLGEGTGAAIADTIVRELTERERWLAAGRAIGQTLQDGLNSGAIPTLDAAIAKLDDWIATVPPMFRDAMRAAASGVQSFFNELVRMEELFNTIVDRGFVHVGDVLAAMAGGFPEIAQDFMNAMQDKASDIGDAIFEEVARAAAEAAEEAAEKFVEAFTVGIGDLASAIETAFGSIGDLSGAFTRENAELELELILAQRGALTAITFLEQSRLNLLIMINNIQEEAAKKIAIIEQRIAGNVGALDEMRDAVSRVRDEIALVEEATAEQIVELESEIEAIEAIGDAAINAIRDTIAANNDVIDGLNDQLDAKREILSVDKETLRAQKSALAENKRLLKDLESQLKTVQDERARAFAVLGITPEGEEPPATLLSAAQELKRLQDLQAQQAAPTAGFSVVDQSPAFLERQALLQAEIDEVQRVFDELATVAEAEAQRLQDEIEAKVLLVAKDELLLTKLEDKIVLGEREIKALKDTKKAIQERNEALQDEIDSIKEAVEEQVAAVEEQIATIETLRDAQVAMMEDLIEWIEGFISATEEAIKRDQERIDSINAEADARVKALEDEIAIIDTYIKQVEDHIATLQKEIRVRAEDLRILALTLLLHNELLETDEELLVRVDEQITQAIILRDVLARLRDRTFDATDAFHLLALGLADLAALILAIIGDPNIEIPDFHTGVVNVPRDTVAMVHAGEMVIPPKPAADIRKALVDGQSGGSKQPAPRPIEIHQDFHIEDASPAALQHRMRMSGLQLGVELAREVHN